MAGYLFAFDNHDALIESMSKGRYSTLMAARWGAPHLPTLADYVTMRPGDRVYFFSQRMVYGIGEIVEASPGCTFLSNRNGVTKRGTLAIADEEESIILKDPSPSADGDKPRAYRWVITFQPCPFMFSRGIDMDDLLSSNKKAFRALRVFERRSFIQLDDEEELAFRTAILRRNIDVMRHPSAKGVIEEAYIEEFDRIHSIAHQHDHTPRINQLLATYLKRDGSLDSEAALELALLKQLGKDNDSQTLEVFGDWDYLSHQVVASPAKSIQYMDRMDVFGYRWLDPYDHIIEKYLIAELKKDVVCGEDLQQVMKYVDWVNGEYASGDYSLISAFLVGHDFDIASIKQALPTAERHSLDGYRPPIPRRWLDIRFVKYEAHSDGRLTFSMVAIEQP